MKPADKCEICGFCLTIKNRQYIIYEGAEIYLCNKCMHKVVSYIAILKGCHDLAKKNISIKSANFLNDISMLKKILKEEYKALKNNKDFKK